MRLRLRLGLGAAELKHFSEHILLFLRLGLALRFGEWIHLRRAIDGRKASSVAPQGGAMAGLAKC